MNREALEHLFDQMDCTWTNLSQRSDVGGDGYLLLNGTLSADELSEISTCEAGVRSYAGGGWLEVFDDE